MYFDAFMDFFIFYFLWIRDQKSLVSVLRFFQSSLSGHQTNMTLDVNIAWISRALAHKVRPLAFSRQFLTVLLEVRERLLLNSTGWIFS